MFVRAMFIFLWGTAPTFSKINSMQLCLLMLFSGPQKRIDFANQQIVILISCSNLALL